jgi:hypothetical protein
MGWPVVENSQDCLTENMRATLVLETLRLSGSSRQKSLG